MKKRKGRISQLLVMSVISLAMALSIYRNPEYESLVVLLLLWCYFGWNLWTTQQLAKSRSKAVVELERSTVLIRCVTELSSHEDMDRAINNLLKIVTEYFEGDRSYIVKVDYENQLVHNTYEHAAPGITKEIDNLQQVPLQVVQSWLDKFQKHGMFYISDLDREKEKEAKTYDILKAQNINSLIAVPFKKDGTVIGFFGVDNPRKYYRDFQLLSSIQFFLMNRLEMKDRQEQLQYLSYRDLLTNLYNRNYYIRLLEKSRGRCFKNLGVVYIDLNGLKQINDEQGHEAGDSFIRRAAQQIVAVFPERTYRIGGDEFVVIYPDILQQQFEFLINQLRLNARQHHVSISCGSVWRTECMALDEMLKEADEKMYEDKKKFYEKREHDRRRDIRRREYMERTGYPDHRTQ